MKIVYFIRPVGMEGPVKIGCSEAPEVRLKALMFWSPFPLEIAATVQGDQGVERRFHGMFVNDHTHKEWFRPSARLSAVIERLASGAPLTDVLDASAKPADFRDYSVRRSPEYRRRISYTHRIRWAFRGTGTHEPLDAYQIMNRWSRESVEPTEAEIARLEEVLANPSTHGMTNKKFWAAFDRELRANQVEAA